MQYLAPYDKFLEGHSPGSPPGFAPMLKIGTVLFCGHPLWTAYNETGRKKWRSYLLCSAQGPRQSQGPSV